MSKETRRTFYTTTQIFEADVPASAKLVLAYLSRVANRRGVCFPSIETIAEQCGYCKNTVRRALLALEQAGMIRIERNRHSETRHGRMRRTANRYTLTHPVAPQKEDAGAQPSEADPKAADAPGSVQSLHRVGAADEREINHNSKLTMAKIPPSFRRKEQDEKELDAILEKLNLNLYEDQTFACGVAHAIRTMYRAEGITVKKQLIPQGAVRSALRMLRIEHIDYVLRKLEEQPDRIVDGERYLISCIYCAPLDCMVNAQHERHLPWYSQA